MKKYILLPMIALLSCNSNKETVQNTAEISLTENTIELNNVQQKNAGIQIGNASFNRISTLLKVSGKIDVPPQNMVSISVPLGGYLKSTKLLPGMHIKAGESIAIIEDQQYINLQQEYLMVQAKNNYAEADIKRQEELNKSKANSDKVYQQAIMEYNTQKVSLRALSEKLKLIGINPEKLTENNLSRSINIFAPIDGYVTKVNANIGKYVNPSDILFELVNPSDIHLALTIFEKDLPLLAIGQKLRAYTNGNPDKKYACEIILIGKDVDEDRSSEVHCHFDQYDNKLIPGMFMNAEIQVEGSESYVLPEDAFVRFEAKEYVFVEQSAGKYTMKEVKIGESEKKLSQFTLIDNTEIKETKFVVKGAYNLLMSMKNREEE